MEFKQEVVFYLENETERYARIVIEVEENNVYNIVHTFVSDTHRGEGLAGKLMDQAITYIQNNDGVVKADCSYAKHYCDKHGIETLNKDAGSCSLKHAREDSTNN